MIIAVDGPAASGKGTLAAGLARHYGLPHLDTGLLYRAVGRAVAACEGTPEFEAKAIAAARAVDTAHLDPAVLSSAEAGALASKVAVIAESIDRLPPIVIVRLRNMTALDATGLKALEEVADRVQASGRTILFCGAREQPAAMMRQAEFHEHVGERNICANILVALERAAELHKAAAA